MIIDSFSIYRLNDLLCINSDISKVDMSNDDNIIKSEIINLFFKTLNLFGYELNETTNYTFTNFLKFKTDNSIICTITLKV